MQSRCHGMSEVYFALCKTVDTPVSLGAWLRFKHAHEELARMSIDPGDYVGYADFGRDYSVVEFLSKWKGLMTGLDLKEEAMKRFTLAETSCAETNRRIKRSRYEINLSVDGVIHSARRKIARLLGHYSNFCIDGLQGWGPGATHEIARRRAALDTKMCELPMTVTRNALELFKSTIEADLHWSAAILNTYPEGPYSLLPATFKVVDGCVVETVPKNAKTDRVIAKEPRGNSFLQKGFGRYMRERLKCVGIDLDNQARNQDLARIAGDRGLATIDLSMASDTISTELVYELLPWDWASVLDDVRSRWASLPDGRTIKLEKFSSMGNGFTFELETLIFWALTQAIQDEVDPDGVVSVYGDDIICEKQIVPKLHTVLTWAGFTMNEEKSHIDGLFYESCGKHYFDGQDVTPAYQKEQIDTLPEKIRCGNRLIRLAERWGLGRFLDKRIQPAWNAVKRSVAPNSPCPQIPFGVQGDDGWSTIFSEFSFGRTDHNRGIRCLVLLERMKSLPAHDPALLAWTLRRGVVTESPFGGSLSFAVESARLTTGHRWVVPFGKFSITWR